MKSKKILIVLMLVFVFCNCKRNTEDATTQESKNVVEYAQSFALFEYDGYSLLEVKQPWVGATAPFFYVLYTDETKISAAHKEYMKIKVPIQNVVLTSTTHIPALDVLDETQTLVGFPGLDYISTNAVRMRIGVGEVKELGQNEALDTETILDLAPDALIAFAMDGNNKTLNLIEKSGIPVLYNGDWTEQSPLGKAEWIKFFGALYGKQSQATSFFNDVVANYKAVLKEVVNLKDLPTVMSGAMYQDVWYLPQGGSWVAMYFRDAKTNYLWMDTDGVGSLALSFEEVLDKAKSAEYWINPAQFETMDDLLKANVHYAEFDSFKNKKVYSFAPTKGSTGGSLFYELGPNRPDIVLKDLVSIFHPNIFPGYKPMFYQQLK